MTAADPRLLQYELAVEYVKHQDARRWTLYGLFLVIQGILAGALYAREDVAPIFTIALAGVAVVSTLGLWVAVWRSNVYMDKRVRAAQLLQEDMIGGLPQDQKFWHKAADNPAEWETRSVAKRFISFNFLIALQIWGAIAFLHWSSLPAAEQYALNVAILAAIAGLTIGGPLRTPWTTLIAFIGWVKSLHKRRWAPPALVAGVSVVLVTGALTYFTAPSELAPPPWTFAAYVVAATVSIAGAVLWSTS